ncbi:MAG: hypothetical protein ABUT39_20380 [Acidobacteriota bacterium]
MGRSTTQTKRLNPLVEERFLHGAREAPHRLRDLADVIELIRANGIEEGLSEALHPYVRPKFLELWQAAQVQDGE